VKPGDVIELAGRFPRLKLVVKEVDPITGVFSVECSWWAGCHDVATQLREHPVFGNIPVCSKHTDEAEGYSLIGRQELTGR
jgi:hypothetical protein